VRTAAEQNWVRAHAVVVTLIAAHVILKLLLLDRAIHAPLQGDEVAYTDAAKTLANVVRELVTSGSANSASIQRNVIGNGWFMPGMSLVLLPLYLVAPHSDPEVVRIYLGVFTTGLLVLVTVVVRRTLGHGYGNALLVFPGLVPMWVLYSYSAWGDLAAGLTSILLLVVVLRIASIVLRASAPSLTDGLTLGSVSIVTLYLRSSALPLVVGLLALVAIGIVVLLRGKSRWRGVLVWILAATTFGALLFPWSVATSRTLGDRVLTTTTLPLSEAVAFGDTDELCFGPCNPGNIWYSMVNYSREVGRASGSSELVVQKQMSRYALRNTTVHDVARGALDDWNRYALKPSGFESTFRRSADSRPDAVSHVITWTTNVAYFFFLALSAAGMLLVTRRSAYSRVLSLLLKLCGAAMMIQPFVHVASPRYWPVFAPMMALAGAFVVDQVRPSSWVGTDGRNSPGGPASKGLSAWLTWLQAAATAGWVLVPAGLVLLAR
jgi:hypothetical protein